MLSILPLNESDREKAEYLYNKYRQVLFLCAMKIVKNAIVAEDIVQTTFIAIFRNLDSLLDCDSKRTANYLKVAVKHFAFQEYHKQKWIQENCISLNQDFNEVSEKFDVWDKIKAKASAQELLEAFNKLDDSHRFLLIGKYYYGFTYRELAKMINITENAVSTRIVLAKQKLAEILRKEKEDDETKY